MSEHPVSLPASADGATQVAADQNVAGRLVKQEPLALPSQSANASMQQRSELEAELKVFQLRLERAKIDNELRQLSRPWWRSWNLTALGALLATVAPLTAGVQGYFEKQKQVALAEQKQQHEMAMAKEKQTEEIRNHYLDRMKNADERATMLRFLAGTSHDPDIVAWTKQEQAAIERALSREQAASDMAEKKAAQAETEYKEWLSKDNVAQGKYLADQAKKARDQADSHKKAQENLGNLFRKPF